jgi:hypothetical protein
MKECKLGKFPSTSWIIAFSRKMPLEILPWLKRVIIA